MPAGEDFARDLLEAQPDRFASQIAGLPPADRFRAMTFARRMAALVRATRATYVLHVAGDLAPGPEAAALASYANLHIAGAFGHTGRLEVVVNHEHIANTITAQAERHALADRVSAHAGDAPTVVRALNGPYDLAVVGVRWRQYERLAPDLTRLLRIGGALTIVNLAPLPTALAENPDGEPTLSLQRFLRSLAADERYLLSTGLDFAGVIAARVR